MRKPPGNARGPPSSQSPTRSPDSFGCRRIKPRRRLNPFRRTRRRNDAARNKLSRPDRLESRPRIAPSRQKATIERTSALAQAVQEKTDPGQKPEGRHESAGNPVKRALLRPDGSSEAAPARPPRRGAGADKKEGLTKGRIPGIIKSGNWSREPFAFQV